MYTSPLVQSSPPVTWRIGLQGAPGAGKTTSALTFPNPVVLDFDHKLPPSTPSFPMWNPAFVDSIAKRTTLASPPNYRDAIYKIIAQEATKLSEEQTLIIDSWTILQSLLAVQCRSLTPIAKDGNPDGFKYWGMIKEYSSAICAHIKQLKCMCIVTFHETPDRNEDGTLTGLNRPLMDGSFKDELAGHYTDFWRQVKDPRGQPPGFYWQVLSDRACNCNCNPSISAAVRKQNKQFILSDYKTLTELLK